LGGKETELGSGLHGQQFPELFSDFVPAEDTLPKKDAENGFDRIGS